MVYKRCEPWFDGVDTSSGVETARWISPLAWTRPAARSSAAGTCKESSAMGKKTNTIRSHSTRPTPPKSRPKKLGKPAPARKTRRHLGPFSFLILQVLDELPPGERYGVRLEQELRARLAPELVLLAQIYTALGRLKAERLVRRREVPSPATLGYNVVLYEITDKGRQRYNEAAPFYRAIGAAARHTLH